MSRTLRAVLGDLERQLAAAGVPDARLEARLLLELATGLSRAAQLAAPHHILEDAALAHLARLLERRLSGEPLAYLTCEREFYGRSFEVGPAVLVPRPESELLIELAVRRLREKKQAPLRILDVGTGSGCLLISLLCEFPDAFGVGTDLSFAALEVARRNARRHGVAQRASFVCTDFASAIGGPIDLVVANPPYLTDDELRFAQAALGAEPRLALAGGADGLDAYRALARDLPRLLADTGFALLELAAMRAQLTADLFAAAGFTRLEIAPDLAGLPRALVIYGQAAAPSGLPVGRAKHAASSTSADQRN